MGTSVNHGSPRTTHWKAVQTMYRDARFPVDRVLREMWRAATDLQEQLKDPRVGRILEVALTKNSPADVSYAVAREASRFGSPNLAIELARRAAVQTAGSTDRANAFVQQVFAEASNYIVSRDLPGNVGLGSRNLDVSQSTKFKSELMQRTREAAKSASGDASQASAKWTQLANRVVGKLAERE